MGGKQNAKKYLLTVLGLILSLIWVAPFYLVLINAFKTKKDIFTNTMGLPTDWMLQNFTKAGKDLKLTESFANSLIIVIVSITVIIIFSSMAAYALQRNNRKTSTVIFLIFAVSMLIPFQAIMIPLVKLFGSVRMLNLPGLIFMYLGLGSGSALAIILYHGALKGVPQSLDEAALIDGCGRLRTFWKIIFPMLKPNTVTIIVLDIIWIWNDYLLPSLIINKEGMRTLPLMTFYFFGQYTKQWHLAMAGLTIAIIPVLIFYFFAQNQIMKGIMSGALKQ